MMGRKKNVQDEKMMILYGSSSHEKEVDAKLLDCTLVFRREKNTYIDTKNPNQFFWLSWGGSGVYLSALTLLSSASR